VDDYPDLVDRVKNVALYGKDSGGDCCNQSYLKYKDCAIEWLAQQALLAGSRHKKFYEITEKELLAAFRYYIAECGSNKEAAKRLQISIAYLNQVLSRKAGIGPAIYRKLGYERVVYYKKGCDNV